jgi:DNA-binding LacI/PurR family transcriptional regulator
VATIKDVAKRAGVAISTVSAVMNRSAPTSVDVVARVEQAIADIGYVPHGAARSLRRGRSQLIGLVVPDIANPHFAAAAREVENICLNAGFMTVVYSTGQDFSREQQVLSMMRVQRVAGLVVIPTQSDAEHGNLLRGQITVPTVLLDMFVEGLPYDVIKTDNAEAGRLAADYLLGLGHRRIAVIVGIKGLATSDDRHAGYVAAHADRGVAVDKRLAVAGDFSQARAHAATIDLMRRKNRPTAIIAISNMMTIGMLLALKGLGVKVPQDVSIVGIDDLEFAAIVDPPPTVVTTPILAMARRAVERLLTQIATKAAPSGHWEIHQPKLTIRESCRRID